MGRRGFTLMEVLLATAILALIVTTVYGAVARSLNAKNRAEARAELYAAGRDTVLKMADEIEAALAPRPGGTDVYFYGVPGQDRVPNDAVVFVRVIQRPFSASQQQGGRAIITYALDGPIDGTPNLFALRRQEELPQRLLSAEDEGELAEDDEQDDERTERTDAQGTNGTEEAADSEGFSAVHLLDRVAGLKFQYLNAETGEWVDSWDTYAEVQPGKVASLPGAVQIVLLLADQEGAIYDFQVTVDLPLANLQPTPTR